MIVASFFAPREERWACNYLDLLQVLDASCRRVGLRHLCISDTELQIVDALICNLPHNLMAAILDGQRQCLEWATEPVLFVGADCVLTRDPRPVMAGDITITIGPFSDCEMNTGAIWCADPAKCAPVWREAVDLEPCAWGDDQRALYTAIDASDLDVRKVRCEEHNWAPTDATDAAGLPTVAHFRGNRKRFMAEWARHHLGVVV